MPPPEPTPFSSPTPPPAPQQTGWPTPSYYADGYPTANPAEYYAAAPQASKTLGVVAFIAGLVVVVGSPILSAVTGGLLGHIVPSGGGFDAGFAAGSNSHDPQTLVGGLLILVQLLIGSGLGIWALVQGIIAVRRRRGRGWGIAAIVLAAAAPLLSFVVYLIAIAVTQSAG